MSDAAFDERIAQTNQRLKLARLGLQIERRGSKLALRGTLPPRPNSHRLSPHQQRIPLNLPATPAGLKQAEQTAKVIAADLIQQRFDWQTYLPVAGGKRLAEMDLAEQLLAFRHAFFQDPRRTGHPAALKSTWDKAYAPYFRKLEAIAQERPNLTLAEVMTLTLQGTRPNTRSRQVCCTALQALAEFLQVELPPEWRQNHWGSYGNHTTQRRDLPSDAEILAAYERIPNPAWRWVYGLMAAYGLRNHEVFFCDCSALERGDRTPVIEVLETTKTGNHLVWPFPPDWVDTFDLRHIQRPPLKTDLEHTTLQRIGQQVALQFRRYDIPFSPYDLRHAWAVRTIHIGIPDTVAAKMMGHSVAIHTRTYHRWITFRDQSQAVETALNRWSG